MKNNLFLLSLLSCSAIASHGGGTTNPPLPPWHEADYVDHHFKGKIEHVLPDRTRVDCLTDTYVIEYDWGIGLNIFTSKKAPKQVL